MFMAYARHEELKKQLIEALARATDPNDRPTQRRIAREIGISLEEFSDKELIEMGEEIGHKWALYH